MTAEDAWTEHCARMVASTLLAKDDSQYFGSNIPGKPRVYNAYIGGVGAYRIICQDVADNDYEGFEFVSSTGDVTSSRDSWSGPRTDGSIETRFGNSII